MHLGPGAYAEDARGAVGNGRAADFSHGAGHGGEGDGEEASRGLTEGDRLWLEPLYALVRPSIPAARILPEHDAGALREPEAAPPFYDVSLAPVRRAPPGAPDFGRMLPREPTPAEGSLREPPAPWYEPNFALILPSARATDFGRGAERNLDDGDDSAAMLEGLEGRRLALQPDDTLLRWRRPGAVPMALQLGRPEGAAPSAQLTLDLYYRPDYSSVDPHVPSVSMASPGTAAAVEGRLEPQAELDGGCYAPNYAQVRPVAFSAHFARESGRQHEDGSAEEGDALLLYPWGRGGGRETPAAGGRGEPFALAQPRWPEEDPGQGEVRDRGMGCCRSRLLCRWLRQAFHDPASLRATTCS